MDVLIDENAKLDEGKKIDTSSNIHQQRLLIAIG